ncbi:hypothetical protein PQE72_gp132 [Bacillus phage vB_BanS_Skywalker]|uniref:Uncharacterized protein n=1 Tax=Bacillus phage vB_BanS_Skywalker TaxID=2894789 RepID=A0AAE8YWH8_9CAUD|nr:hypothetical protein PQE72_gp132 [Bacillus phage vB_BanS_Skywalker]UGO51311.1 hypothetical protein SKYWALKER_154 [Bacillus phage vB_BanS_Skywalker]
MVNIIHERFPEFGNATCEDDLLEEVFKAKVAFGKDIKIVFHPKYYRDCFQDNSRTSTYTERVNGVSFELSTLVDTYVLEFIERG